MYDTERLALVGANTALVLLVTDLWLGILLEWTGIYPGAMALAKVFAGGLFVLVGLGGLVLVVVDFYTEERQTRLTEWV